MLVATMIIMSIFPSMVENKRSKGFFFSAFQSDHLWFYCRPLYSLQKLFQDLSLGDRNHVELFFEISIVGLTQV